MQFNERTFGMSRRMKIIWGVNIVANSLNMVLMYRMGGWSRFMAFIAFFSLLIFVYSLVVIELKITPTHISYYHLFKIHKITIADIRFVMVKKNYIALTMNDGRNRKIPSHVYADSKFLQHYFLQVQKSLE